MELHQVKNLGVQVKQVVVDPGGKVRPAVALDRLLRQTPAHLGGDDNLFLASLLELPDQAVAAAVAVDIRSVEKVDARVDGLVERGERLLIAYLSPGAANGPGAKTDL